MVGAGAAEIVVHERFKRSRARLTFKEQKSVDDAVRKYAANPRSPGLNLESLEGGKRLRSIRASKELRILLARVGRIVVLGPAGHHDQVYGLARRLDFVVPVSGLPSFTWRDESTLEANEPRPDYRVRTVGPKRLVEDSIVRHWTDAELRTVGFSATQVDILRQSTVNTLTDTWRDISEDEFELVCRCAETSPEDLDQLELIPAGEEADELRLREAISKFGALAGLSSVLSLDELNRLFAAPIEDWMIFLHPDQQSLVDRTFNGAARVRGAAGTGKTVVAQHRAAVLAKRYRGPVSSRPILFTTFINSLPPVFENLYDRLPGAASTAGTVDFVNIDKLAHQICRDSGHPPRIATQDVNKAFGQAYRAVVSGTPLAKTVTRGYLKEELSGVLDGRDVETLDEYLALQRTGRKTPFDARTRTQVWELYEHWRGLLREAGAETFPDVVRRARDTVRRVGKPAYRCAIIDESQDLSLIGLQLVRALVEVDGEIPPDGLFLVGDGAQRIYPGGFTLAQAGVDVRGNSAVLRVNYRNTEAILRAAMACAGNRVVDDANGDQFRREDGDAEAGRLGIKDTRPRLVCAGNTAAQQAFVCTEAKQLCESGNVHPGDIGVFATDNGQVKSTLDYFERQGLACQKLADFNGVPNNNIKIGTFHRAKGLEFKAVFLLGLTEGRFPSPQSKAQSDAEYAEACDLQVSALFVAMTRARDRLYLLSNTNPSLVLYEDGVMDHFDEE